VRGARTSAQTIWLSRDTDRVRAAREQLAAGRCLARLWDQDPALWADEPGAQQAIRSRLGWLTIPRVMASQAPALAALGPELRRAGLSRLVLLGMGGSALFPDVCSALFGVSPGHPQLLVFDTVDPAAIRAHQQAEALRHTGAIVASKSGSTVEVACLAASWRDALSAVTDRPGDRMIVITDAGTPLEAQARAWQCRRLFTHGPGRGAEVGGRYGALTAFGLVPASVIGVDAGELIRRAEAMLARCAPQVPLEENPAAGLAAALAALAQAGQDKLTLACAPPLAAFGAWLEQLIAESLGKRGRGIVPVDGEPVREPQAYGPDRLFVELQLSSQWDAALDRRIRALSSKGVPVIRIHWEDRYDVGGEVIKWAMATALAGHLLGIDPFDEPNVQDSKDRTNALLDAFARDGALRDPDAPCCAEGDLSVSGSVPAGNTGSLGSCLRAFFRQGRLGDYVAVLSFLPRTPSMDRGLAALRERLAGRLTQPVLLSIGPRYLHSIGQLYKGGPETGLFVLLTADEHEDLAIPGQPFTFGTLKRAQALGDFQAMRQANRRIVRVHLRGDLDAALQRLAATFEEAAGA